MIKDLGREMQFTIEAKWFSNIKDVKLITKEYFSKSRGKQFKKSLSEINN